MEGKACVYALKHNPTGKIYVGCSKNVERRINEHIKQLRSGVHNVKKMQDDFNEYGNDYSYYILFEAYASYDAFMMEKHFMSLLDSRDPNKGYNYGDNSLKFSLDDYKENKLNAKGYKEELLKEPRTRKNTSEPFTLRKLREFRKRMNCSVTKLSKLSGISRQTIYHLENDSLQSVNSKTLKALAEALEVKIEDLLSV